MLEGIKQARIKLRDLSPSTGSQTMQTGVKLLFKEKNGTKHTVTPSFLFSTLAHNPNPNAHTVARNKDNLKRIYEMCLHYCKLGISTGIFLPVVSCSFFFFPR